MPGGRGPVPVIGVSAAGQAPDGHHPVAQWNMFEISGEPGNWSVRLTRRAFTGTSTPAVSTSVELIEERQPAEPA